MEDYRVFHDLLLDTVASVPQPPGLIEIAIVYYDPASRNRSKSVHTSRFQCRPNLRLTTLVDSYSQRFPGLGAVIFYHKTEKVVTTTGIKDFVPQKAGFIVLQALPASWSSISSQQEANSALLHAREAWVHLAAPTSKLQLQSNVNLSTSVAQGLTFIANVDELCNDRSADELEACARKAAELLDGLASSLQKYNCPDTTRKQRDIEALLQHFHQPGTTIAVVGATGSGKSSLINAILDVPSLIPTGCTSACTSVATEIAYNWKDSAYRAEIRFMRKSAWRQMLERLFHDILDEDGNVLRSVREEGSESAIALSQLLTVYPDLDVRHLERVSIDSLMNSERLKGLGTFIPLDHADPCSFSEELRQYLSSESGLWPLIASVKVFVRAAALATGAVLVDLPGVMDTNQARSHVSKRYMQDCDHIFVVAPMKRAVDDSVAHNLVSTAPKEQVQLDGLYGHTTFIGTHADDAKPQEVSQAYNLQQVFRPLFEQLSSLRMGRKSLEDRIKKPESRKTQLSKRLATLEDRQKALINLREKCRAGEVVYSQRATKRKSEGEPEAAEMTPKKLKAGEHQARSGMSTFRNKDAVIEPTTSPRRRLTEPGITKMIEKFEDDCAELSLSLNQAFSEYGEIQGELEGVRDKEHEVESRIHALAIVTRNENTSDRIRRDFKGGYRGLVQASESEQSDADRAKNAKDIEDIGERLNVFMVSAAAYQVIRGRERREDHTGEHNDVEDGVVPQLLGDCSKGFSDVQATEIPQLQEFCRRLTDDAREKACRRFVADTLQFFASLQLWASEVELREFGLSNLEQRREKSSRKREQEQLKDALNGLADQVVQDIQHDVRHRLYAAFERAVMAGRLEADNTAMRWGLKQALGGLHFMTYRAVLRHLGTWTSSKSIAYDFNKQLGAEFKRRISREWELLFTHLLPDAVNRIATEGAQILENFTEKFCERNKNVGTPLGEIEGLSRQLPNYKADLTSIANEILEDIQREQRQVNRRGVEPVISSSMRPIYQQWNTFSGKGMLERMRNAVERHVSAIVASRDPTRNLPGVFEACRDTLRTDINNMVQHKIRDKSLCAMKVAIDAICKSCNELGMGPSATVDAEMMDPRLKTLRKEVREVLKGANSRLLKAVLGKQVLDEGEDNDSIGSESELVTTRRAYDQEYEEKGFIYIYSDDEMDVDD